MRDCEREELLTLAGLLYDFGCLLLGLKESLDTLGLLCGLHICQEKLRRRLGEEHLTIILP
jgi:hypothetical protein